MSRRRDTMSRRRSADAERPGARQAAPDDRAPPRAFLRRADFAGGPLSGPDEIAVRNLIDLHNDVARVGETMERVLEGQTWADADQLRAVQDRNAEFRRVVFETLQEITSRGAD